MARERAPCIAHELVEPAPASASARGAVPALFDKPEIAHLQAVVTATADRLDRLDREGQPSVRLGDVKRYDAASAPARQRERAGSSAPSATQQQIEVTRSRVKLLSRPKLTGETR